MVPKFPGSDTQLATTTNDALSTTVMSCGRSRTTAKSPLGVSTSETRSATPRASVSDGPAPSTGSIPVAT